MIIILKAIFQCNLAICFLKDSRVALTFEQTEQIKPPVCTCFDSMCVFTWETFLDAKLHCKQNHCPVSSFCRLATIRSSSSEEKQMYLLAYAYASCAFSKPPLWDICKSRPNIENHQSWHALTRYASAHCCSFVSWKNTEGRTRCRRGLFACYPLSRCPALK